MTFKNTHYHFVGIGGIGMSALAQILLQRGEAVSGSDTTPSPLTQKLEKQGAEIFICHDAKHLRSPCTVIYSSAVKEENPELEEAKLRGFLCLHRSELLHRLMGQKEPLLVTGTHGKTTGSSLLAHLLVHAELDPSYAVGGYISSLDAHAGDGKGDYFVAEADESDGSFLTYSPFGAIITNIDNDHLDYWKNIDRLVKAFGAFARRVKSPEHLFWCGDDDLLRSLQLPGFSYGFDALNQLKIHSFFQQGWKTTFDVSFHGKLYSEIHIPLIGAHNVLNAAAVFGLGLALHLPEETIRKAFICFKGVSRRSEFKGSKEGIAIFDDYGHHPTEIFATLRAMKQAVPHHRLIVAFQPHRYSRTRDCLHEFGRAFECADQLILTDIYAAGETPIAGITVDTLLHHIKQEGLTDVCYVPRSSLAPFCTKCLKSGDVLVTMGAGDITRVGDEVMELLTSSPH